jgi:hypothetical protein
MPWKLYSLPTVAIPLAPSGLKMMWSPDGSSVSRSMSVPVSDVTTTLHGPQRTRTDAYLFAGTMTRLPSTVAVSGTSKPLTIDTVTGRSFRHAT